MRIKDVFEEYINFMPLSVRTKELYIYSYNRFWKDEIGDLPLTALNYAIIQSCINKLVKRYGYNTVKLYKCAVFKFIEIAELKNKDFIFLGKNSVYIGKPPKKKTFNTYALNEFYELMSYIQNSKSMYKKQYTVAMWIGFFTGMRIGEVLALTKKNINLKREEIYITKSKTPNGVRTIYMCNELKKILSSYVYNLSGEELFPGKNEKTIRASALSCFIRYFTRTRGYTIHFHTLREMFVKNMIDNGASVESVRCILGHANTSTTMNLYLTTNIETVKRDISIVYDSINFIKN